MNPLLQAALASILRHVFTLGAGYFVAMGIWSPDAAQEYVAAAALAVIGFGWAIWQKYRQQAAIQTALDMPAGSTQKQLEKKL